MGRPGLKIATAALLAALAVPAGAADGPAPDPAIIYATQSGTPALDVDPFGGNPFASALIAALERPGEDAADVLRDETLANSMGEQQADTAGLPDGTRLLPVPGEVALALVIAFADYGSDVGLVSLPGAAFDAARVAATLGTAGYETSLVIARDAAGYRAELGRFAQRSASADRALVYTTGHGVESGGTVYLVAPDFERLIEPDRKDIAITLSEVAGNLQARETNLLFYAGCRDNPLKW